MKRMLFRVVVFCLCILFLFSAASCQQKDYKSNNYRQFPIVEISDTGITWPEGQAIPTMAPVSTEIDRVFVDTIAFTNAQKTTITALQGLVNKEKPRILLQTGGDDINRWIPEEERDKFNYIDYKRANVWDIFVKYKDYYKGFIVFDSGNRKGNDASGVINLANTVAGLKECLPVDKRTLQTLKDLGIDYPAVEDFSGKFNNNIEVYNYLYENYWKDCNKRILFSVSPHAHPSNIRDLAVAIGGAIMWLDPTQAADIQVLSKFLKEMEPGNGIVMGWWTDEGAGIKIGTNNGIPTVPADYYENSTIHGGMDRNLNPPPIPDKPVLENKIYVAPTMTDGDNIQFNQHVMRQRWDHKKRGEITLNWTISPALADVGPDLLNYYYRTATPNDCLVSGPSGLGYTSMENMFAPFVEPYAKWSDQYLGRTNIKFITVWRHMMNFGVDDIFTKNVRSMYGASILDWGGYEFYEIKNDKPLFPQVPWYSSGWDDMLRNIVGRSKSFDGSRPIFLASHAVTWETGVTEMLYLKRELDKQLGPENYVFVRLDHMSMLINEYENKPYNLCLRQETKIEAGENQEDAKKAADGTFDTVWTASDKNNMWITFDLGEEFMVSRYILKNIGCDLGDRANNTRDYKVLVSTDGDKWKEVDKVVGNEDDARDIDLEPVKARFVKFEITDPGADGVARICDIEIYGVRS